MILHALEIFPAAALLLVLLRHGGVDVLVSENLAGHGEWLGISSGRDRALGEAL